MKANYLLSILIVFIVIALGSTSVGAQTLSFNNLLTKDIEQGLHQDEYELIEVGDNRLPIFIQRSELPINKGLIFILSDADVPLGKSNSLHQLAGILPKAGWTTVLLPSLGLQLGPNIAFPITEDADTVEDTSSPENPEENPEENREEENQEDENDAVVSEENTQNVQEEEPQEVAKITNRRTLQNSISEAQLVIYATEVEAYLQSGFEHMSTTMGHRIVLTQGISAATIVKLVADGNPSFQEVDALIVHSPYWPIRELNKRVPSIVAQTEIPVLDLFSEWDNAWSKQTRRNRQVAVNTELKEVYRQVEIVGQELDASQADYIAKTIKGWTTYLGW
ncbi:DUF3530 family protein [Alteromonas sp. W364]|uniref:DUF3530 family protein n=1 Tax=Alteromonas sp. W364 TaxID=3075610 RepID=UPI0028887BBA|nr:DUF3530 family protein [Alteromonas sp. W364]MDT0628660.1 DUF3530 family protein [Alteromonas sp. W364]